MGRSQTATKLRAQASANLSRDDVKLTPAQAARTASFIEGGLNGYEHPDDIARLLLLCAAFTYEESTTERESMYFEIEKTLGHFLPGFDGMITGDLYQALASIKKGGE